MNLSGIPNGAPPAKAEACYSSTETKVQRVKDGNIHTTHLLKDNGVYAREREWWDNAIQECQGVMHVKCLTDVHFSAGYGQSHLSQTLTLTAEVKISHTATVSSI